ncbi:Nn.00g113130.m01.CDS01 [Neocucurbitaria sp. VM-36]
MHFQSITVLSLAALAVAAPTPVKRQSGPVLADTTYNDISIAGGVAGNAEAEALAVFSALDLQNPENIDPADIEFLGAVNDVANDAEVEAFNTAIEAATGDEADQIQNGKIKNKVLKLMATKIELEAKQAQGDDSVAAKLEDELAKLNNNIAIDTENAGQTSIAEPFDATISGGGNVAAAAGNANSNANANNAAAANNATVDDSATATTKATANSEATADDAAGDAADDAADEEDEDDD